MEDKDQRQGKIIDNLRNDIEQIKFENQQLKELFSKCEVAIQSLRTTIYDSEYKTKMDETNVSDFEYPNAISFAENMKYSMDMSNVRDNATKQLPLTNRLIKRSANRPTITGRDSKIHTVGTRHAGTDLVAFFATLSIHATNLGVGQNVKFDNIITNVGSAYNQHVGAFAAPVSGVYVFMSTLLSYPGHNEHFKLVRNGNIICYMFVGGLGGGATYDTSAGSFVLFLNKGDVIAVQNVDPGENLYGDSYSYFSGFLLKEFEQDPSIVG
ncbi:uncharacterized protein LOC127874601 [Dreissena polymorpha]|uniref:C1q domain-containing protein n=1 Tax=Dreissena polymorpha TaxID=45954 RepID=A0A9D4L070_DREPO|nr:uncharacterized protein LOC127874601 [Dreissena polymorpha]KAH3849231.1 hypothetical protein DPMN_091627 [Dreissena polymorpha]